jgi:hypothetical protein
MSPTKYIQYSCFEYCLLSLIILHVVGMYIYVETGLFQVSLPLWSNYGRSILYLSRDCYVDVDYCWY